DLNSMNEQAASRGLQFYPNPAQEWVRIENAAGSTLRLYNLQGQLLLERRAETESVQIPIQHLSPGTYVLMQFSNKQIQTGKLLVR
ncbi:MAG: T9SS type A sorting domain-containing protein, partial [Lentimicrobiaceae bacterium]|nr:T9SS type A sorting domain-containing protein [Lentimicrobiaceae bacterium]